jgi:hypothetical protein
MLSSLRTIAIAGSCLLLLTGCARDVVLKPTVISFNNDARAAVDAARKQYTDTIVRLNDQTAIFLAEHPECGLKLEITPRPEPARQAKAEKTARTPISEKPLPLCLTRAEREEKDKRDEKMQTAKLRIASEQTFVAQFDALQLLLDYVTFLGTYADDPKLTLQADIQTTAEAARGLEKGVNDVISAQNGKPIAVFSEGGIGSSFAGALKTLAGQFENIAKQASDIKKLRDAINASEQLVNPAIDQLADNADLWRCAEIQRLAVDANKYAETWDPKFTSLDLETRQTVARKWISLAVDVPAYCPGVKIEQTANGPAKADGNAASKNPYAQEKPVNRSNVARMLVAVKAANTKLIAIAHGRYTAAQRKAMVDETLRRLGTILSGLAPFITLI